MKRRRIAPNLISSVGAWAAMNATADATLLDDHHLRVRRDIWGRLRSLSVSEFAPPEPTKRLGDDVRRRSTERACSSPLSRWSTKLIKEMGYDTYKTLYENKVMMLPYVYKHYVDKNENEEHFVNDAQTDELMRRHRDTISFWMDADIDNSMNTEDVMLLSMHGSDLKDNSKLVPAIMRVFEFDEMSDVLAFASKVKGLVEDLPEGYDNPLLTLNAVATRSTYNHGTYNGHDDASRRVKDSIIIGDGVLRFLYDSGLESSGPDFVHAHEFGHHLQFQMDIAVPPGATYVHDDRRKELMADALGGYFLAHDLGGDFDPEEIAAFDETAYSTGDCSVGNDSHHGTPRQRRCAAVWGASLAAPDRVPALDPEDFVLGFNRAYVGMLNLDSKVCTLVLEETSLDYPEENYDEDDEGNESELGDHFQMEEAEGGNPVKIDDWLDAIKEKNQNDGGWGGGSENLDNYNPMDNGDYEERESSWDAQGENNSNLTRQDGYSAVRPSIGHRPNQGKSPWADSAGEAVHVRGQGNRGGASPGGEGHVYLVDRGSPSETRPARVKNALTNHDCRMPWVHCYSSPAGARHSASLVGPLLLVAAIVVYLT